MRITRRALLPTGAVFGTVLLMAAAIFAVSLTARGHRTNSSLRRASPPDRLAEGASGFGTNDGGGDPAAVRFGVCDWTIGKSGDPAALELAAKLGLEGVQVSLNSKGDSLALLDPALQKAYLDACRGHSVGIASFAIGELNDVPYKSDSRAERWVEQSVEIAKAMGVRVILVPFFGKGELRNDPAGLETVIARLRRAAPKAEKGGVLLALESYLSAEDNLKILERVGSPAVRVYYDVANSQDAGYDILGEIRLLGGKICEFHAKDTKDLYGKGSMDFPAVRKAMEEIGYEGWFVLEGTKMPLGIEQSVRYDLDFLKGVFRSGGEPGGDIIAGIGLTHLTVYDQKPAPDGLNSGSPHLHAVTDEGYYVISGAGRVELHDLRYGFRTVEMTPGRYLQFPPGTLHRLVNTDSLVLLVVMGNAGLAERGDARIYFGKDVDDSPAEYARLVGLARAEGLEGALKRRDAAVKAYQGLLALWRTDRKAYDAELRRFTDVLFRAAAGLRAEFAEAVGRGPAAWTEKARLRLGALPAGSPEFPPLLHTPRADTVLGMCGVLKPVTGIEQVK